MDRKALLKRARKNMDKVSHLKADSIKICDTCKIESNDVYPYVAGLSIQSGWVYSCDSCFKTHYDGKHNLFKWNYYDKRP